MSRPLHIGIDTVFFTNTYSGISKVWETLLYNLNLDNIKITLLVRQNSKFTNKNKIYEKYNCVDINPFFYPILEKDVDYLNMVSKTLELDYFISTYYTYCTIIPNILLIHDMIPEIFKFNQNEPMWKQKSLCIKNASHFITVSKQSQKDLIKYYPYLAHTNNGYTIQTIYNSVYFSNTNENNYILQQFNIKPKSYCFTVATNNNNYKNNQLIINCWSRYNNEIQKLLNSNITMIFLGKFEKTYIKNNILFISHIDDSILISLYKNALCTIIPSLYEGFSLPMFESFYYQTPVIAIQNDLFDELAPNAINYIENDVDTLFNKIKQLSNNITKVQNKIELGKSIIS